MTYRARRPGKEDSVQIGVSVSQSIKDTFFTVCAENGDTPSNAIRKYIYTYLKENNNVN